MKSIFDQVRVKLFIVLSAFLITPLMAQNLCQPVGWATQNGGTTGGGNSMPTIVTNYNEFKTAITSTSVKVIQIDGTIENTNGR